MMYRYFSRRNCNWGYSYHSDLTSVTTRSAESGGAGIDPLRTFGRPHYPEPMDYPPSLPDDVQREKRLLSVLMKGHPEEPRSALPHLPTRS